MNSENEAADRAGNKAANDLEPGSGDSDPVKIAAKNAAAKKLLEAQNAVAPAVAPQVVVPQNAAPPVIMPKESLDADDADAPDGADEAKPKLKPKPKK